MKDTSDKHEVCDSCGNSVELCECHLRPDWCVWCGEPDAWCECEPEDVVDTTPYGMASNE